MILIIESKDLLIKIQTQPLLNLLQKEFSYDPVSLVYSTQKYDGKYVNGRMEGNGMITFSNGIKFQGCFKQGAPFKECSLIYPNGTELKGSFDRNFKVYGKAILYGSKGQNITMEDGYKHNWILCGNQFCGKKTLFHHLKLLFSYCSENIDENIDFSNIKFENILEIFQFFSKKLIDEKPNHNLIDELIFLTEKVKKEKILEEKAYFMKSIVPIILKLLDDKDFKEIFIKKFMDCPFPEHALRVINELNYILDSNFSKDEIIRIGFKKSYFVPTVLDKEDLFERIQLFEQTGGKNVYKTEKKHKYVLIISLIDFLNIDEKNNQTTYSIFEELLKSEAKFIVVFSKKDLFEGLFSKYFEKFKTLFSKECNELEITEKDHEKALKIILHSFSYKTEKRFEHYFMNLLSSNDVKKLFFLNTDYSTKTEKETLENEKIFLNEYMWNTDKSWKLTNEVKDSKDE